MFTLRKSLIHAPGGSEGLIKQRLVTSRPSNIKKFNGTRFGPFPQDGSISERSGTRT